MSHYYTVRQSNNPTQVIVSDHSDQVIDQDKVTIVETVVETGENGETLVNSSQRLASSGLTRNSAGTGNPDTVQLMGMASTLPSSNIFVNYPHTMWERDSEGNRIPVTVVKTEDTGDTEVVGQAAAADLLGQATADIKTENDESQTTTVITIPAAGGSASQQVVLTPTASGTTSGSNGQQRIVVTKTSSSQGQAGSNGEVVVRPHVCDVCNKTFAKREHLTKHLRIHKSDNKRYSCEYCQKAFRDRYELVRHTRRHTGDFPFRCQECNKGFMRHERYMTHLRWHSGERPYLCTMCEKSFRDRSELNRHSRRHTGDLPYKCETCGKGFLRRERYVTHVRIHTGEKPFVCAVCSRGYRDRRELKKHQTTHNHSGQSAPIPGTGPVNIPPPNAASVTAVPQGLTKTIVVQQATAQPTAATAVTLQPQSPTNNIVTSSTVHLPSTPVPKELLNINGQATQVVTQRIVEPLNPATIPLPPQVASALQSINEKVTRQQRQKQLEADQHVHQQMIKAEPIITLQGSPTHGSQGNAGGSGAPLIYYIMPGSVPYSLSGDGGTTVQVKTSDGSTATAQLVTVPSGSIQSIVQQSSSGSTTTTSASAGNSSSWILETSGHSGSSVSSSSAVSSRNSM